MAFKALTLFLVLLALASMQVNARQLLTDTDSGEDKTNDNGVFGKAKCWALTQCNKGCDFKGFEPKAAVLENNKNVLDGIIAACVEVAAAADIALILKAVAAVSLQACVNVLLALKIKLDVLVIVDVLLALLAALDVEVFAKLCITLGADVLADILSTVFGKNAGKCGDLLSALLILVAKIKVNLDAYVKLCAALVIKLDVPLLVQIVSAYIAISKDKAVALLVALLNLAALIKLNLDIYVKLCIDLCIALVPLHVTVLGSVFPKLVVDAYVIILVKLTANVAACKSILTACGTDFIKALLKVGNTTLVQFCTSNGLTVGISV